tara:strand:+ start:209 stop:475 length:267 start_codon:yes stop_codon:yes gene_type:complete
MDIEALFMKTCDNCNSSNVCRGILYSVYGETGRKKTEFNDTNLIALAFNKGDVLNNYYYGDWCKECDNFYVHTYNDGELIPEIDCWYE